MSSKEGNPQRQEDAHAIASSWRFVFVLFEQGKGAGKPPIFIPAVILLIPEIKAKSRICRAFP
jgi:hypothetical protein